ncbi:hypothetical protein [Enterococcus sp.]|uniref:hypothetical protein n=1 Tax=Enterococcus sp. TaxID=35783 RepID=UPI0029114D71|nr:hypothetical protein [Enterococcus sp.]MDU5337174.1 hypothetical protein [Enterococcus sp.]
METKTFVVTAASFKPTKEFGWIRVALPNSYQANWKEMGMHVNKNLADLFTEPGLFSLTFETTMKFGSMPQYTVEDATPILLFSEVK